jgi:DNA topoisomerase I
MTAVALAPPPDVLAAARAAGLRHVDDRHPGYRRRPTGRTLRQGKRHVPVFLFQDGNGHRLTEAATLDRIRRLAIPPAWRDVWICPHANGHIQATGRDARGRKQYRYHAKWRDERDSTKYSRMIALGHALPALRRRVTADLAAPGLPRRKVLAAVVRLLETTFIRVGNEEYARTNKSFGLTTMKDRHVTFRSAEVRFHFRGKSGVGHDISIHDAKLAKIVRRCRDLPGQELFQYLDAEGEPATIDSADVNEYIREAAGEDFTAKDFRTWAGTVLAAGALTEVAADADAAASKSKSGKGKRERRPNNRDIKRAIEHVAERLGNTVSVCRKCYVHPEVIASYLDGSLGAAMGKHVTAQSSRTRAALRPEETAVLALLKRRRSEGKAGTRLEKQLRRSLVRSV